MRNKLFYPLGVIILATLAVAASARAQTTAAGPYYATPSWDQKLQCDTQATCPRFIVLSNWNNEAVLDRETSLVWERSPSTSTDVWFIARIICANKNVGGRKGWRLPSINEFASLIDPSVSPPGPTLPAGHPFTNALPGTYWSATKNVVDPTDAWGVDFGSQNGDGIVVPVAGSALGWCVRGGGPLDNY